MNLRQRYLRAAAETKEQFDALLSTGVSLIYIDSGYFQPKDWKALCGAAHAGGKAAALRLPHIFRTRAEQYFSAHAEELFGAGFDALLVRNLEELFWLSETPLSGLPLIADYTVYSFNRRSQELLSGLFPEGSAHTFSAELNLKELAALSGKERNFLRELPVYGRLPMMVSAQCPKQAAKGCDRKPETLFLKDRTGALLPVKNCCPFCYNTILNAKPVVLFDLKKEIDTLSPDSIRYEFTTESGKEVKEILSGKRIFRENEFTRGHFRRGVL